VTRRREGPGDRSVKAQTEATQAVPYLPPWPRRVLSWIPTLAGLLVVFGLYFLLAGYYLDRSAMNADEGFYAEAARSVMAGRVPYRDFGYTQMPLLPYVNGVVMSVVGFGLREQRLVDLSWGAIGLLCVVLALRHRFDRWEPGFLAAWAVAASPWFASYTALGKSYAAGGMFLAGCALVFLTCGRTTWRTAGVAVLGTLAAGCRLHLAVPVAILMVGLLLDASDRRQRWMGMVIGAGVPALAFLPFFMAAPRAFVFFNCSYHLGSTLDRRTWTQLIEWWSIAPAALVLLGVGAAGARALWRRRGWGDLALLLAALLAVTTPLLPKSAYGDYIVPVAPFAALAGINTIWVVGRRPMKTWRHLAWGLPLLVLLLPLPPTIGGKPGDALPSLMRYARSAVTGRWRGEPENPRVSASVDRVARFLRQHVPRDREIITPFAIVAVESGHRLTPGTEMGMFSTMAPGQEAQARALHMTTVPLLIDRIRTQVPGAVVRMRLPVSWNFGLVVPSLDWQPLAVRVALNEAILSQYRRAFDAGPYEVLLPSRGDARR
jgi:hypothetical protein